MTEYNQGDKVKVIDPRGQAEKNRVTIGQSEYTPAVRATIDGEEREIPAGTIMKVSAYIDDQIASMDSSPPRVKKSFINGDEGTNAWFKLVEAAD